MFIIEIKRKVGYSIAVAIIKCIIGYRMTVTIVECIAGSLYILQTP